jgi:hypothetical protein
MVIAWVKCEFLPLRPDRLGHAYIKYYGIKYLN